MPHIIIEHSSNIILRKSQEVLADIHNILAEMLPTNIVNCKGRVICHDNYLVGNGEGDKGFIYLTVQVLPGRKPEALNDIATQLLGRLKIFLAPLLAQGKVQLSVAIIDVPTIYIKAPN